MSHVICLYKRIDFLLTSSPKKKLKLKRKERKEKSRLEVKEGQDSRYSWVQLC